MWHTTQSALPAFLIALWLGSSHLNYQVTYVAHFAAIILLIPYTFIFRLRSPSIRVVVLGAVVLASYVRPEFFVSALGVLAIGLVLMTRSGQVRSAVLMLIAFVGIYTLAGVPVAGGRGFLAFSQHYSVNRHLAG